MVENLNISEDKKNYITNILNPLLEEFVTSVLTTLPEDPVAAMASFAASKKGGGGSDEVAKLKKEIEEYKSKLAEAGLMVAEMSKTPRGGEEEKEDEEEEEEDDDDELDEIPESMKKPEGQMKTARASVSAEAYGAWNQKKAFTPPSHPKSDEQKKRLADVLSKSFLFSALETKELDLVIGAMLEVPAEPEQELIKEGDDGDFLFVIETGVLDCKKKIGDEVKVVKTCEAGDAFGELALLYNCPRAASVVAREKCVLWKLDRDTFNHIVKDAAAQKRTKYESFLAKVPLLGSMDAYERSQVADALARETFADGAQVVQENDPGDKFFIIEDGEAFAEKEGVGKVMDYKAGDYFGELALLRNQPRAATVKAKGALTCLTLPRTAFKRLLGPLDSLLSQKCDTYYGK